jgi:predicted CopG family antitoxin
MGTKTISIREDVYETLKSMKREDESISDAVERLIRKKEANLEDFFGVLKDSEVLKGLEEDTERIRASSRFRI